MSQDKRDKSNADRSSSATPDDKKPSDGNPPSKKTSPDSGSTDPKQTGSKSAGQPAGGGSAPASGASPSTGKSKDKASDKTQSEAGKASSKPSKQTGSQAAQSAGESAGSPSQAARGSEASPKSGAGDTSAARDRKQQTTPAGGTSGQAGRAGQSTADASAGRSSGAGASGAKSAGGDESRRTAAAAGRAHNKTTTSTARTAASGSGNGARPASGGAGGNGRRNPSIGLVVAVIALIFALFAVAAAGYLWYRGQQRIADLDSRVNTVEKGMQHNVQKVLMPKLSDMHDRMGQFSQRVDQLSKTLDQRQQQIKQLRQGIRHVRHQNSQLSDQLGGNHERFVEQRIALLLEAANQRLQVARDPRGAAQALKLADQAIAKSGDPELHPVRAKIANEMAALKALPHPDIEGLSLKLSNDVDQIPKLALKTNVPSAYHAKPQSGDDGGAGENASRGGRGSGEFAGVQLAKKWHQFLDSVGGALSRMVTIRRANGTENAPALMAPDQSFFLRQNLQLQLRVARLALINGNAQTYHHALSESRDWIKKYFDTGDSTVSGVLDDLSELSHVKIDWQAPDLSGSLKALHRIMDRNENDQGARSDDSANKGSASGSADGNAKQPADDASDKNGSAGAS